MPIEDIDFLYENSVQENMVILVDSNYRDREIFPSAAEFEITFDEPLRFIYGIDILDTTIPRTMFMMDINNNKLSIKYGFDMLANNQKTYVSFLLQDFSSASSFFQRIESQISTLGFSLDNYDNIFIEDDDVLTNYTNRLLNDYPIMRFKHNVPFLFDMKESTVFNIFGFDKNTTDLDFPKYLTVKKILSTTTAINVNVTNNQSYEDISLDNFEEIQNGIKIRYFHDPKFMIGTFLHNLTIKSNTIMRNDFTLSIMALNGSLSHPILENFQYNIINGTTSVFMNSFNTNLDKFGSQNSHIILRNKHLYEITIILNDYTIDKTKLTVSIGYSYNIPLNNLDWNERTFVSNTIYDHKQQVIVSNTHDNVNIHVIEKNDSLRFPFEYNNSVVESFTAVSDIGTLSMIEIEILRDDTIISQNTFILSLMYDENVIANIELIYQSIGERYYLRYVNDDVNFTPFSNIVINYNDVEKYSWQLYSSKLISVFLSDNKITHSYRYTFFYEFGLISPGIINLASENYVLLRCPEIENHLLGSYSTNQNLNPGIAVLNIDVQGYASGRSEFYSVKYKEFHPIGRLNKLRFRFERKTDKHLYDFKNVDLHFLMSIKYLVPKNKTSLESYVLNPNYTPNYVNYVNNEFSSSDSEIDEGELKYNEQQALRYMNKFK